MKANEHVAYLNLSRNQLGEYSTGSLLQQALGQYVVHVQFL